MAKTPSYGTAGETAEVGSGMEDKTKGHDPYQHKDTRQSGAEAASSAAARAQPLESYQMHQEGEKHGRERLDQLIDIMPPDTPDEYVLFGYGGISIRFGDLKDALGVKEVGKKHPSKHPSPLNR